MYLINGSIDDPQPKKERRYHPGGAGKTPTLSQFL